MAESIPSTKNEVGDRYSSNDLELVINFENESSKRVRWILIILITASSLGLGCLWNSFSFSWKHKRVETFKDYISFLDKVSERNKTRKELNSLMFKACDNIKKTSLDSILIEQDKLYTKDNEESKIDTAFLSGYYGKNVIGLENLRIMYMIFWLTEAKDTKCFKIPFFDVNFDINDLGFIGGLGFSIILLLFYLSLIREKENIKIAFRASKLEHADDYVKRRHFYYLLSMNQSVIMPHIMNKKGKRYLKILPLTLLCFPFVFSLCVFINDVSTNQVGSILCNSMTNFEYCMSSLFLTVIVVITIICVFEAYNIDQLWKEEKIWLDNKEDQDKKTK